MPSARVACLVLLTAPLFTLAEDPVAPADPQALLLAREDLDPGRNPLVAWRSRFEDLSPPDDVRRSEDLIDLASTLSPGPQQPAMRDWLADFVAQAGQWELPADRTFQLPPITGPETPFPDHVWLQQLARVRLVAAKLRWEQGDRAGALALCRQNLALGRAFLEKQEGILSLISATSTWQTALDGVQWLAAQPGLSAEQARALLAEVQAQAGLAPHALARAFRGEYSFVFDRVLARIPPSQDADRLLAQVASFGLAGEPGDDVPAGERIGRIDRVLLDPAATRAAYGTVVRAYVDALATGERLPRGLAEAHVAPLIVPWSAELAQVMSLGDVPVTPAILAAVRAELTGTDNPLGKLLVVLLMPHWDGLLVQLYRREAQRSALCALLAWRLHGAPAEWDELVAQGVLAAPPVDPFGAGALRVDPADGRVWSVFLDGQDDGGEGHPENFGMPRDLAWTLPREAWR